MSLGAMLCAGAAIARGGAQGGVQAADGAKGSFLLIDGGAPSGQPRLTGCDRAMSDLHAVLDQAGTANTVLIAPTAGGLREALLGFGANNAAPHAVLFCGYAAETGGNIFALGSDTALHDDLAVTAVSIRAFSRVAGDKGGLVLLDLHPVVADGAMAAAAAGALDGAAAAWTGDATLDGTKLAVTDRQPGDATLMAKAARSGAGTPDGIAHAVAHASPPAPPAQVPAQVQAQAQAPSQGPAPTQPAANPTPGRSAAPSSAAHAPAKVADAGKGHLPRQDAPMEASQEPAPTSTPALAPAPASTAMTPAPGATGPDAVAPSVEASGGAIALAPPGIAAAKPVPPRPRVHADPAIRKVQVALLARGLFSGRVNGVGSPDTQRAIGHFQAMLGHPVTGQLTADETKQLVGG